MLVKCAKDRNKPSSSSLQHSKRISKMNGSQNMHWLFLTLMKLMVTTLILATVLLSQR